MRLLFVSAFFLTSACSASVDIDFDSKDQHPFLGCWESEDGLAREIWSEDPSGWLFGYAVNRDDAGKVTFFEQMWIDGEALFVSGPNDDTVAFKQVQAGPDYIFENPDHDFPQRISYTPTEKRFDAYISAMDGSQRIEFKKQACD